MNAIDQLLDEFLELEIQTAAKRMEIADHMMHQSGWDYFGFAGDRDHWRLQMEALIAKRSPAQIARMEEKISIA